MSNSPSGIGHSPTAEAFGAEISTPEQERSLYFAIGSDGPPDAAIRSVGGRVVARLQDPRSVLALAPLAAHAALREDRSLRLAGPVTIDPERFERFTRLIGLDNTNQTTHPKSSPANPPEPPLEAA